MNDDAFDSIDDDLTALLREERARESVTSDVSARIRNQLVASVGPLGIGAGIGAVKTTAATKAAVSVAAKTVTASGTIATTSVVVAPKIVAMVVAGVIAGGVSVAFVAKLTPRSTSQPTQIQTAPDNHVPSQASRSTRVRPVEAVPLVPPVEAVVVPVEAVSPSEAPSVAPTRASSRDRDLARESELVAQARGAVMERRWQDALVLIEQHGRKFAHGRLAEERESLRVPVLMMLGRHDEARSAAQRFHARYPSSIFASGVDRVSTTIP